MNIFWFAARSEHAIISKDSHVHLLQKKKNVGKNKNHHQNKGNFRVSVEPSQKGMLHPREYL